jgi:hypothetical protein
MVSNHFQVDNEIRIWPHHFDTGIYLKATDNLSFGFGLAMEDNMVGEPYFYFSAYGLNDSNVDYPVDLKLDLGHWIIREEWKGACLKLSEVSDAPNLKIQSFLKQVLGYFLNT